MIGSSTRQTSRGTPYVRYAFALSATLLALGLKLALGRWTQNVSPFLLFTLAVMVSAWFGGFGPGLLATLAGALAADYFLLTPVAYAATSESDVTRLTVFALVGVTISWLSGALSAANVELEQRVRQRTTELAFQKALLESQIEASRDGILAVSEAGEVIYSNGRFREVWGLTTEEASAALAGVRDAMRRRLAQRVDVLAAGGDGNVPPIGDGSHQALLADGRVIEQYSAQIPGGAGASRGRVWFFRDITERRRLEKQILEAGERERQIIGQDLHDDLCQQLTGIACLASVVRQRLAQRSAEETADAAKILVLVQQATACCRSLSKGLQPVALDAGGLLSSLQELCAQVETVSGVPCRFSGDAAPSCDDSAVPTHLYRIAQEAVTNAVKHAGARSIAVDLVRAGDRLILSIEDDGVGIPDVLAGGGIGLQTMAHRAHMIGATLSVERSPGGGTVVTCSLINPAPSAAPVGAAIPARAEMERAHA